jgi:radical SAM superfamily enzyme YgiQ (UPF0313 family)
MKGKITLIESKAPGFNIFSFFPLPRLGLLLIGAILKKKGYEVKVYIQEYCDIDYADVSRSDVVGISTLTSTSPEAYRIAEEVKKMGIPVVMGGPHATFMADEALDHADYVIRGEGEDAFVELLEAISKKGPLDKVLGLSYKENGAKKHNPDRPLVQNLDLLPLPDFSLVANSRLKMLSHSPIQTTRGCPFDCTFCTVTQMFGRGYRVRNIDSILEEISLANQNDSPFIFFYDDNFFFDKNRAKILLEKMLQKDLVKKKWSAQPRIDVARDKELLDLMRRTKCDYLYVGFESINPMTLKFFNKKQNIEEIRECIKKLHDHDINIHAMFIFGSDEDTVQTIWETVAFAKATGVNTVGMSILVPWPGTQIYKQFDSQNRIFNKEWGNYDGHHVVYQPLKMSPYELQVETIKAIKSFYSIPHNARQFLGKKSLTWFLYKSFARLFLIKKWEKANRDFYAGLRSR